MSDTPIEPHATLRPGELWHVSAIVVSLRITKRTFQMWEQNGLPVHRPRTSAKYVRSEDVIDFICSHSTSDTLEPLIPNYKRQDDSGE